jgi:hypothetical protein
MRPIIKAMGKDKQGRPFMHYLTEKKKRKIIHTSIERVTNEQL